jgi:large subunit ribosomal protein L23
MKEIYDILFRPLVTEKSTAQKEQFNKVAFVVNRRANKIEIRQAVEKAFKVRVVDVCTSNVRGKKKRMGRIVGQKSDWKKAVVTLAPGDRIEFFEGA